MIGNITNTQMLQQTHIEAINLLSNSNFDVLNPNNLFKVKSCYNPLRLGTVIVLVSSGIDFVNTPRLYSDRATS